MKVIIILKKKKTKLISIFLIKLFFFFFFLSILYLASKATPNAEIVIVGSSFIGMEAAAVLVKGAKSVTVIGMEKVKKSILSIYLHLFSKKKNFINFLRFHLNVFWEKKLVLQCKNSMNQKISNLKWELLLINLKKVFYFFIYLFFSPFFLPIGFN